MSESGQHRTKRKISADQVGITKTDEAPVAATIWIKLQPKDVFALDKLVEVFGGSRPSIVRRVLFYFIALDDDAQRSVLIKEELISKKSSLLAEQQKIQKELGLVESDIKRLGIDT